MTPFPKFAFLLAISCRVCHGVVHVDCPPTNSPVPTESPAPSPSPSEAPTDTQSPSESPAPTVLPSMEPSTSHPSPAPTTAPTESPAPSPSPSEAPTVAPSFPPSPLPSETPSYFPSGFPSYPPSASPSSSPTSSPTITPQPTDSPTMQPSSVPSVSPSHNPTTSVEPSAAPSTTPQPTLLPTKKPSDTPSASPTKNPTTSTEPSVSTHPTTSPTITLQPSSSPTRVPSQTPSVSNAPSPGPVGFAATGITIEFQDADTVMSSEDALVFEDVVRQFLEDYLPAGNIPDVIFIEFDHVEVTDQTLVAATRKLKHLRSLEESTSLRITFSVYALVLVEQTGAFNLKTLLEVFFADINRVLELRGILDKSITFVAESSALENGDILGSNKSGRGGQTEGGMPILKLGAIVGILLSAMGSSAMYIWIHRKGDDNYPTPKLDRTSESTGDDPEGRIGFSDSSLNSYEEDSEPSTPRILIVEPEATRTIYQDRQVHVFQSTDIRQYNDEDEALTIDSAEDKQYSEPSGLSFYKPALLQMESNIEIPETPKTDYDPSQFSPKEDQSTHIPVKRTPPISSIRSRNDDPSQKPSLATSSVASFLSPRLLGAWKVGKEALYGTEGHNSNKLQPISTIQNETPNNASRNLPSNVSPKRSPIRRNILRHDVCSPADAIPSHNANPRPDASVKSTATSIQVMNEVAYLFSRSDRPDPEPSVGRDASFSSRSIRRMNSKGGIHGARVDYSGNVDSKSNHKNRFYISDDESYASV